MSPKLPIRLPTLMIVTPKPLLKPDDLKLYKAHPTTPVTPEPKKTVTNINPKTVSKQNVSVMTTPTMNTVKSIPLTTVLSEQGELDNFVKNNLKDLDPKVKLDRLKKMMDCYRDHFYRDVPYTLMQTEHNFYDYLIKKRFPELIHYLGLTKTAPQNFPAKSDKLEYYLKIERIVLPLARALDFNHVEIFKKNLNVSSFQKGFGDYLTGENSSADARVVQILTKGREIPLSFRSAPTNEIYKPELPGRSNDELSTEEERFALLHYIEHYFVGKDKKNLLQEIKYTRNATRLHLLWTQLVDSIEKRAEVDGKTKVLYFEAIISNRISSRTGWRIHPTLSTKRKKVLKFHKGCDFPAEIGTRVLNPGSGKAIETGYDGVLGKYIKIKQKNGLITCFAHLSKINIKAGDEVPFGRVIGETGDTGRVSGPNLHVGVSDPEELHGYQRKFIYSELKGYKTKKIKKGKRLVKEKRAVYRTVVARRSGTSPYIPTAEVTMFFHKSSRLSSTQLKTKADYRYAMHMRNILALNEVTQK